jgi:signal transduction histidine kinase
MTDPHAPRIDADPLAPPDAPGESLRHLLERETREREQAEAQLASARAELVRTTRLAALGQISASIAHELRNPLGTIRNALYFLKRKLPAGDPKVAEHFGLLEREVGASERIINNLLEVTRPREPVREPVNLAEAVAEALARFNAPPGVCCRSWVRPDPLLVHADPVQLRLVLDNLLKNALEALARRPPPGPGEPPLADRLSVCRPAGEQPTGEVRVEALGTSGQAIVTIRDNGSGVAAEHRPSLFEPLFSTKPRGTGLGLWVCRQIVERHGGAIRLLDEGGPGSAFEVRLPLGEGEEAPE